MMPGRIYTALHKGKNNDGMFYLVGINKTMVGVVFFLSRCIPENNTILLVDGLWRNLGFVEVADELTRIETAIAKATCPIRQPSALCTS